MNQQPADQPADPKRVQEVLKRAKAILAKLPKKKPKQ